jgi:hypothetical protein
MSDSSRMTPQRILLTDAAVCGDFDAGFVGGEGLNAGCCRARFCMGGCAEI